MTASPEIAAIPPHFDATAPDTESWRADFARIYASGLFDHVWYAAHYPDVRETDLSPLEHYVKYGARLGRRPRPDFAPPSFALPDDAEPSAGPFLDWIAARAPSLETGAPLVSVLCITYNQAAFIRQTLDSLLGQKTDFPYEVLVGDDRSSDGTAAIVADYAAKHPNLVPVLRETNLGPNANFTDLARRARGTFIAMCEGDDYWTDPDKLQIQVDFLRERPEFTLCFHPVRIVYDDLPGIEEVYPKKCGPEPSLAELTAHNLVQTNSVLYRWRYGTGTEVFDLDPNIAPGDWYVHLMHAEVGRAGFIPRVMAVYRKHAGGMWATYESELARHKKLGHAEIEFFRRLSRHFGGRFAQKFRIEQTAIFQRLAEAYLEEDDVAPLLALIRTSPDVAAEAMAEIGFDPDETQVGDEAALRASLKAQASVSVVVTSYNQVDTIRRCLDGVLMQRGLFRLEVVVGDDASHDGTAAIVEEVRARHPDRVTVLPRPRNLGMLRNMQGCIAACTGRFIAFCEGDDYWLSDRKLAKQLRMLRRDPALDLSWNWVLLYYPATGTYVPHEEQGRYATGPVSFVALARSPLTANFSCCVYRAEAVRRVPASYYEGTSSADWLFALHVADAGRIGFLRDLLSVYTVQGGGQWSGLPDEIKDARVALYQKEFAGLFGEGRGFEEFEVGATVRVGGGGLPAGFARGHLERPGDRVWHEIQDGQVVLEGWVVRAIGTEAVLRLEVDGEPERVPVDMYRPDVIAAVLGETPTTIDEARCGFRFVLPYAAHLEVQVSVEIEGEVHPWLSIIFTHRIKPKS